MLRDRHELEMRKIAKQLAFPIDRAIHKHETAKRHGAETGIVEEEEMVWIIGGSRLDDSEII
jgi:hypothetical protein